jgi:hypothetical protein
MTYSRSSKILSVLIFFIFSAFFVCHRPGAMVNAGGGPIEINVSKNFGNVGSKIPVQAILHTDSHDGVETGRKAEFRIKNQRSGDVCVTTANISDGAGKIYGECFAAQAGKLEIYVYWFDRDLESSSVWIDFVGGVAKPVITQTPQPSAKTVKPSVTPVTSPSPVTVSSPGVASPSSEVAAPAQDPEVDQPNRLSWVWENMFKKPGTWVINKFKQIFAKSNQIDNSILASPIPVDKTPPQLSQPIFDKEKSVFNKSDVCVNAVFSDENGVTPQVRFSLKDQPWSEWGTQTENCWTQLKDGEYELQVEAKDDSQNMATASAKFIVQTSFPVTLSGVVYHDRNCNYQRDADEPGLPNISVQILESTMEKSRFNTPAVTDGQGKFASTKKIGVGESIVLEANVFGTEYVLVTMSGFPRKVVLSPAKPTAQQQIPLVRVGETSQCQ